MKFYKFIIVFLFFTSVCFSQNSNKNEIQHLLNYISKSNCSFERNEKFYKSPKVIKHILYKKEYFKDKINSTEEFIKFSATKSEVSGKKYKVHCKNTKTQELGLWLFKELESYRKSKK